MKEWPALTDAQRFIVEAVAEDAADVARRAAERFGLTRQAVNQQIRRLTAADVLRARGHTRSRTYSLATLRRAKHTYAVGPELDEGAVWRDGVAPLLADLPENVRNISHYGVTEMVRNAQDHSGSANVTVSVLCTAAAAAITVADEGVGVFRKIRDAARLVDERHALLELHKGRLTTDPASHTGDGVFFTARMFDEFVIRSGQLALTHRRRSEDWSVEEQPAITGTRVSMKIRPWARQTDRAVFASHAVEHGDFGFQRTHVMVALAQDDRLISRSQAQRLMARLEGFAEVVLDFKGVTFVGPAFADEIFRVFRAVHPRVTLVAMHAAEDVERMIRRAENATAPAPMTAAVPEPQDA
jgi:anti-sigma regulatory factor (Ser/Thr protein kinase)